MMPGSDEYFKCSNCDQVYSRGSLMSGNTFGAKLFSDGKNIAPMLPEFPRIVKCKKCNTFFWLIEENEVTLSKKNKNIEEAVFLTIYEIQEAIDLNISKNNKELEYLRIRLWWALNDKIRENDNIGFDKNEKILYESNCKILIELLDKNNLNEKIMIAELFRNIGNYNECKKIMKTIKNKDYNWIKDIFENECQKNNSKVILLRQ